MAFYLSPLDYSNISRFLNRILGLKVVLQNAVFQYFTETLNAIIREAKRNGRWDEGIVGKLYCDAVHTVYEAVSFVNFLFTDKLK